MMKDERTHRLRMMMALRSKVTIPLHYYISLIYIIYSDPIGTDRTNPPPLLKKGKKNPLLMMTLLLDGV